MVFFDVTVANSRPSDGLRAQQLRHGQRRAQSAGLHLRLDLRRQRGQPSAWTQIAQDNGSRSRRRPGLPSAVTLQQLLILLPAGTYGMALVSNGGHRYTNGNGTNQTTATAS
jgi:hypothetical protein